PPANDRFCPNDLVLRDQMASFLGRAMNLEPRTPPPTMAVAPYFFLDEDGHTGRSGPFLAPIHRTVAESAAVATASMQALLNGPTSDEQASIPALSTAIPDGTTLNSVSIEDGVATVDLSAEFEAEEASAAASARTAQVVFTLTRFSTVDSVSFLEDGAPVSVRTDNGNVVDEPVDRGDYLDYQAAISVESPTYGGFATDPLRVTGQAAVFEATFQYALTDADGLIIEEGVSMSGSGVGWAGF